MALKSQNNKPKEDRVDLQGVRLMYRNFSGKETTFNAAGKRNFNVILTETQAAELAQRGYNVRTLDPKDEYTEPLHLLKVSVQFRTKGTPPRVVLVTERNKVQLDESMIAMLDTAEIVNVDLRFRGWAYDPVDKTKLAAQLMKLFVTIEEDPLESKYYDTPEMAGALTPSWDDE